MAFLIESLFFSLNALLYFILDAANYHADRSKMLIEYGSMQSPRFDVKKIMLSM